MPTVDVKNLSNEKVGELELSDDVFGVELNESLIYYAVNNYLTNQRQGTVQTKTRGNTSGSGKKLWKQKGTGRARIASLRSPLWKGGGNVHGPQPRDWSYSIPRKMRRGALRSALSERLREGNLIVIDEFGFDTPKTRDFVAAIVKLGLAETKKPVKMLIVDSLDNANLVLSSRNVEKTKVTNSFGLNIYDLLYHEKLLISKAAAEELNDLLDPVREHGEEPEAGPREKVKKAAKTEKAPEKKEKAAPSPREDAEKPKKAAKPKDANAAKEKPAKQVKKPKAEKEEAAENE